VVSACTFIGNARCGVSAVKSQVKVYRGKAKEYADVRIYNRALSASEINQLYNAGR
jgi:hypothetical protein